MTYQQLKQLQKRLQVRLAIWIILAISFYMVQALIRWPLLKYVTWLETGYCLVLFGLYLKVIWRLWRQDH